MNPVLENKLQELESAKDYECWYLVKQPTAFSNICYLVSFLKAYKSADYANNLQDFISEKITELKSRKPEVEISNNYRALRVAAFFGLITMTSTKYDEALITETFEEITEKCSGEYENTACYEEIIQRQIEKMYISSSVDEEYKGVREKFRLYPVMLLYKVLLEMGHSTGKFSISIPEYRYLVATTKRFEGFLETLLQITLLRKESTLIPAFEKYRTKFDNRLIQALKQLPTLIIDKDTITLCTDSISEVSRKVYIFEGNPNIFATDNYLSFLGSKKSLFELEDFEKSKDDIIDESKDNTEVLSNLESNRVTNGTNILLYGVPGSGKSWTIQHEYCDDESKMERLVFHPDYTYSNFVGQILPDVSEGIVNYRFTPGPFTNIMKKAYEDPEHEYFLIIEEINRGNAPAIFGEVFQLLDRKNQVLSENDDGFPIGTSEYGITNTDIANEVYGDPTHKVRIPSNLSIIGTMNTSDQNVFTLDTAFQRRWSMRLIESTFTNVAKELKDHPILDSDITWEGFCEGINNTILRKNARVTSSEDKRIGPYFIHISDLEYDPREKDMTLPEMERIKAKHHNALFAEKVIKYLWDDAFKFSRADIFRTDQYYSLEQVLTVFARESGKKRFSMFKDEIVLLFEAPFLN